MSDAKYTAAVRVFNKIDEHLKNKKWVYDKNVDKLDFSYSVGGDDLPMRFTISVDADRELIRLLSFMPFNFAEDKRVEGAVAVCIANDGMVNGSFGYDISDGTMYHKLAVSYMDTDIDGELVEYIMVLGAAMVDRYNDRFMALSKGYITIEDFLSKE